MAQDLTGIRLRYLNLAGANLASQNLTDASFYGATLTGANLSGAEVRGTDFSRVYHWATQWWDYAGPAVLHGQLPGPRFERNRAGSQRLAGVNLAGQNLAGEVSPVIHLVMKAVGTPSPLT